MSIDLLPFVTILGMGTITYLTRVGGLMLMRRATLSPRVQAWVRHLPGALLVSIVAPAVIAHGFAEVAATILTIVVAARTGNLLIATAAGVAAVWLLRSWGGFV